MKAITEEDKDTLDSWYEQADKITLKELPEFIRHLTEDYDHDYGTICHAMTAGALATIWAINKTPQGGITGFQASAIGWEFITNWMSEYKNKPLRLVNYAEMLYPQFEDKFQKTITEDTWEYLQKEAANKLAETTTAAESVIEHWQTIVDGNVPFRYKVEEE